MKKETKNNYGFVTERYVDIKTVSRYTSLAESTLYEWAATGRIPSIKYGRRVLFDLQDIDKVMLGLKRNNYQEDEIIGDIHGN